MFDTIVAIASGNINQAISIIRISGPDAFSIISKIFKGKIGEDKTISFGHIIDENENYVDEVLVNFFKGKNNFIGEDTVEINAHGGIVVTNLILELIVSCGARYAMPGEFSRRAFLNGKLDLIKAEGINDLIHAKTITQAKIAVQKFNNKSSKLILELIDKIEKIIGICEVNIDYPEYDDVEKMDATKLTVLSKELISEINEIVRISKENQIFTTPQSVVIVGLPNVGKSSLMNAILNQEKSIVTNIEGTTRDIVEGEILFNNIILKFKDTAGIRNSLDLIENIGIQKAYKEIEDSSIIIHVLDASKTESDIDKKIELMAENKFYFKVFNKMDLMNDNVIKDKNRILISAKNKDISQLEKAFNDIVKNINIESSFFFNIRQTALLEKAKKSLIEALDSMEDGMGFDVVIVDFISAWENIKSIVGEINKEDLLDSIFLNFCLGK
ncbi:MAG: tRNA uridine-5-carboxymethylaminomethyl(34) synthesis GTPase MnmE [Metamycoplasmataceae bacterium]